MHTNYRYIGFMMLFCCIALTHCKKLPKGITTTVHGHVSSVYQVNSTGQHLPVSNATVQIIEYRPGLYGPIPNRILDSAVTSTNGDYKFTFTTTGNGVEYHCRINRTDYLENKGGDVNVNTGHDNNIDFEAFPLRDFTARFVAKSPYPSNVIVNTTYYNSYLIHQTTADTSMKIKVYAGTDYYITLSVPKPVAGTGMLSQYDTIASKSNPTLNSQTFIVDPGKFK